MVSRDNIEKQHGTKGKLFVCLSAKMGVGGRRVEKRERREGIREKWREDEAPA